jgi:hypothetical protein
MGGVDDATSLVKSWSDGLQTKTYEMDACKLAELRPERRAMT